MCFHDAPIARFPEDDKDPSNVIGRFLEHRVSLRRRLVFYAPRWPIEIPSHEEKILAESPSPGTFQTSKNWRFYA
jgi:hypothetical protein